MATQISKKRKFVADGVFRAELNEFFTRELAEEGYSGCDVRVTHARTEVRRSSMIVWQWLFPSPPRLDHHPCHTYARGPWGEGPTNSRTYGPRSETFQIPRKLARVICRKSSVPGPVGHRPMREFEIQASWRAGRPQVRTVYIYQLALLINHTMSWITH
jgi:hypothetical protein